MLGKQDALRGGQYFNSLDNQLQVVIVNAEFRVCYCIVDYHVWRIGQPMAGIFGHVAEIAHGISVLGIAGHKDQRAEIIGAQAFNCKQFHSNYLSFKLARFPGPESKLPANPLPYGIRFRPNGKNPAVRVCQCELHQAVRVKTRFYVNPKLFAVAHVAGTFTGAFRAFTVREYRKVEFDNVRGRFHGVIIGLRYAPIIHVP